MGMVYSMHGKDMTFLQNFGQNTSSEETTWGTYVYCGREDNITIDVKNCVLRCGLVLMVQYTVQRQKV